MKAEEISDAMNELDEAILEETENARRNKSASGWRGSGRKWVAAAACLCLLGVGGFVLSRVERKPSQFSPSQTTVSSAEEETSRSQTSSTRSSEAAAEEEESFVSVASLMTEDGTVQEAAEMASVPIETYTGFYERVAAADSGLLSESAGTPVSEASGWYRISGHEDLQYLIRDDDGYSLWKFTCFDSTEYPYADVLSMVYQIDSQDQITEIRADPPTMDNTDEGKAIQEEIGSCTVTDREEIADFYQILSELTCYGEDQWARIDNGQEDAAADGDSDHSAVRLGRYLTLVTDTGNEIDGLKYTAVSDMFYEFSGIAYQPLSEREAVRVCEILQIE